MEEEYEFTWQCVTNYTDGTKTEKQGVLQDFPSLQRTLEITSGFYIKSTDKKKEIISMEIKITKSHP